ncbi:MAG: winged helix-turn-helix transcriptional regulator [Gammaproteobacteria bacterium]|nr:winged helix-turn-helix transcriptional regulator [Gammaproteobacteria bacterium]
MPKKKLDTLDRKILHALQKNARLTNVELAELVGLSPSPCLARVKALTNAGIIKRHVTLLDPEKINLSLSVFIQISLERQSDILLEKFEKTVTALPEVLECYLMTGDSDYLLRIAVQDVNDLREFILNHLTRIEGVSNIRSSLALKQIKYETALPINISSD